MRASFITAVLAFIPFTISVPIKGDFSALEARACIGPDVNAATITLIKQFEGFVPKPAPDPIGLPTVGYGHLCKTKGCSEVKQGFPLSEASATDLLKSDLKVIFFEALV